MVQFSSLGLAAPLTRALADEGYVTPTPIQAQGIPVVMSGKDVLGCAQTGTGKTAAFALPILHRLHSMPVDKTRRGPKLPRALILSPTRELTQQIAESFATYGRHTGLSFTTVFGGVSQFHQVRALRNGVDILIATPGRLMDLMEQRHVNLSQVGIFVLDEADRMLDMGFIQPIRRIAAALPPTSETSNGLGRQTLMFSATMPREIMHLADSLLRNPTKIAVTPVSSMVPLIEQSIYMVPRPRKQAMLHYLIQEHKVARAVVFTKTKHGADKVCRKLEQAGITAEAIHGNKAQNARTRALQAFKTGRSRVLVATDVAARGLDVDGITHVFNFDIPNEPEAYVHRIGRTGRAGAAGQAISFCDGEERGLLRDIERLTGKRFTPITTLPALPALAPDTFVRSEEPAGRGGYGGRQEHAARPAHRSNDRPSYGNQGGHSHAGHGGSSAAAPLGGQTGGQGAGHFAPARIERSAVMSRSQAQGHSSGQGQSHAGGHGGGPNAGRGNWNRKGRGPSGGGHRSAH